MSKQRERGYTITPEDVGYDFDRWCALEGERLKPPLWRPWDPPEGPPDWILVARHFQHYRDDEPRELFFGVEGLRSSYKMEASCRAEGFWHNGLHHPPPLH